MTNYEETAKQIFYRDKPWWKRIFMSRRRKKLIIQMLSNTVRKMDCINKNDCEEFKKKYDMENFTPEKIMELAVDICSEPLRKYTIEEVNDN